MKRPRRGGAGEFDTVHENSQRNCIEQQRANQVPRHVSEALGLILSNNDRDVADGELEDLRRLWWRCAAGGVVLPPERGVIVIGGDR